MRKAAQVLFAVFILLAAQLTAAETPKKDKAPSPREQYLAVVQEHEKAEKEFSRAYQEAKTNKEKDRIRENYPYGGRYSSRFLALAEKYPKDPVAIDALTWVLRYTGGDDYEKIRKEGEKAVTLLARYHLGDERITAPFDFMARGDNPAYEPFFRTVMEKSPLRLVRGKACISLGRHLKRRVRTVQVLKDEPNRAQAFKGYYGDKITKSLLESDAKDLEREAEKLFEQVIAKYSDIKEYDGTLGAQAEAELFEMRHLAIGKTASDIEGEDIDGKRFKLSDYRGKVVVLDFWGHW